MKANLLSAAGGVVALAFVTGSACAQAWQNPAQVQGKVTLIEASNLGLLSSPTEGNPTLYFIIDVAAPTCPVGTWLFYAPRNFGGSVTDPIEAQKQLANTRAVLSSLQLAMATGTRVTVAGYNMVQTGYCQVASVWNQP